MKVSIVTPSYKQLAWLKLCVASVSDQAGIEVEHIVQDAGTGPELETWARSKPNMRLFVEKDEGMYDAVNRGLRRSSGAICAYLNCDEQYLPGTLAKVAQFFTTHPNIDVLFGDAILVDQEGQLISYRRAILPSLRHIQLAHLNTLSCAMFFRRKLLDRGFYFDPALKDVGDGVWMESLLSNQVQMATISEPLGIFAFTGENRSTLSVAAQERASRKGKARSGAWLRRNVAVVIHRIRKALAGAYRRRNLEIDIFTLKSPDRRERCIGKQVGFKWPSPVQDAPTELSS